MHLQFLELLQNSGFVKKVTITERPKKFFGLIF